MSCIFGAAAVGITCGASSLRGAGYSAGIAAVSFVTATPFLGVAAVSGLALSLFGASAAVVKIGVLIPLALAVPSLTISAISLAAFAILASLGLVALGIGLPAACLLGACI